MHKSTRQRFGTVAAADPVDLITARPTGDETINEFGRRVAMIPSEYRDRHWPDEIALDF